MEIFDVVNESGQPTGEIVSRETAHRLGIRHRTAHVWIVRRKGVSADVLLQKRSREKDSFPGCLDTSSAGHIPAGSEPAASAIRELHEELGITAKEDELLFAGNFSADYERVFHGKPFHDNEFVSVYVLQRDIRDEEIMIQPEELESVEWRDYFETEAALARHDPAFCIPSRGFAILGKWLFPGKR